MLFTHGDSLSIFKTLDSYTIILRSCQDTNTNAINIVTSHCEPEALHRMVYGARGAAISPPPNPPLSEAVS